MSAVRKVRPCFLVASDPTYHFGSPAPIRDGLGAFLFELNDDTLADSLLDLFYREATERPFDLTAVPRSRLSTTELVLAKREVTRAETIGRNLNCEEYGTDDDVFRAIGWCAIRLDELLAELQAVIEEAAFETSPPTDARYFVRESHLPALPVPSNLNEALDKLVYVLERHRLLFLYFMSASRRNPAATGRRMGGVDEQVMRSDVRGYDRFIDDIDSEGEFLFRNRWFLDRYVEEAINRFGHGLGVKPDVEGASHPYWFLEEGGAAYLQDSADAIISTARELRRFGGAARESLVITAVGVAYERGSSQWYSSAITRWEYLSELDVAIADLKKAAVFPECIQSAVSNSSDENGIFYLSMHSDERIYNEDPAVLGTWADDPKYLPIAEHTGYFFKVQGAQVAQRLIRLFEKGIKPQVESDGETKFRVHFAARPIDDCDADEQLLIEEQISTIRQAVEKRHTGWRLQNGLRLRGNIVIAGEELLGQRPPLSGELVSNERLFDQAQRWCDKITGRDTTPVPSVAEGPPTESSQEGSEVESPRAPDAVLRLALPTAVIAAAGLRDLGRVRTFYPEAIPLGDAKAMHELLAGELASAVATCNLERVFEVAPIPDPEQTGSDVEVSALMGVLVMNHPDFAIDPSSAEPGANNMKEILQRCQGEAADDVRAIVHRILTAMLYDCRMPAPVDDPSFKEAPRFLQMLRTYWSVVRQLVLHHIDAPTGFQPHPLMPLMVNLKARIDACFVQLVSCQGAERAQACVTSLINIVLSGEPDALQAEPEWSYEQVGGVDRFIEEARLDLGAKSYPMTAAEELCLQQAQKALDDYEQQVKSSWAKMIKRVETKRDQFSPAQPAGASADSKQEELRAFSGGTMVFFQDRVELCGANICSGARSQSRRRILDLLRAKVADGIYAAYSGEELAEKVDLKGREPAVAGVIRDLRNEIVDALRGQARIECGRQEVILSGGRGYRFADCVSVQDGESLFEAPIGDIDPEGDVPNVPDQAKVDVPNDPNPDDPYVPDDEGEVRRKWIVQELGKGRKLRAPDIERELDCSLKTAKRDLKSLKDEGLIEYVGASRTGYYRLR